MIRYLFVVVVELRLINLRAQLGNADEALEGWGWSYAANGSNSALYSKLFECLVMVLRINLSWSNDIMKTRRSSNFEKEVATVSLSASDSFLFSDLVGDVDIMNSYFPSGPSWLLPLDLYPSFQTTLTSPFSSLLHYHSSSLTENVELNHNLHQDSLLLWCLALKPVNSRRITGLSPSYAGDSL